MSKKHRILPAILSVAILMSACGVRDNKGSQTDNTTESQTAEQTKESRESSEQSKPTPTLETVYIPGETLPEGQLFEGKYYAVLPGEGAMLDVYDCNGRVVHSFEFLDGESYPPLGLLEKHEIEQYTFFSSSGEEHEPKTNHRYFPGGYYEWPDWKLYKEGTNEILRVVTDKGNTIIIKEDTKGSSYAEWNMVAYPDSTGIGVLENVWMGNNSYIRFHYLEINSDGTILQNFSKDHLPVAQLHLVGEKYVIYSVEDDDCNIISTLIDLSGNVLLENVTPIRKNAVGHLSESWITVYIEDYFIWNGRTYNAQLKQVPDETKAPDGHLIPGVRYYVDGVLCQYEIQDYWNYNEGDTYAVGMDGTSIIVIKSIWGDCVIRDIDAETVSVLDVSSSMVLLSDYSVYSLKTGEFLRDIPYEGEVDWFNYKMSDEYLIISNYSFYDTYPVWFFKDFYIISKDGNISYHSDKSQVETTGGGYILLRRGPYIGIADINGDWIIKTMDRVLKRDAGFDLFYDGYIGYLW